MNPAQAPDSSGPALRFTPSPARLFLGRLWREGGALLLVLPALWMLFGLDAGTPTPGGMAASGWPVWLVPTLLVYALLLALGLRARVVRGTFQLEANRLVQSPGASRERSLDLDWLKRDSGLACNTFDRLFGTRRLHLQDGRFLRLETSGLSRFQLNLLDRELLLRTGSR